MVRDRNARVPRAFPRQLLWKTREWRAHFRGGYVNKPVHREQVSPKTNHRNAGGTRAFPSELSDRSRTAWVLTERRRRQSGIRSVGVQYANPNKRAQAVCVCRRTIREDARRPRAFPRQLLSGFGPPRTAMRRQRTLDSNVCQSRNCSLGLAHLLNDFL